MMQVGDRGGGPAAVRYADKKDISPKERILSLDKLKTDGAHTSHETRRRLDEITKLAQHSVFDTLTTPQNIELQQPIAITTTVEKKNSNIRRRSRRSEMQSIETKQYQFGKGVLLTAAGTPMNGRANNMR